MRCILWQTYSKRTATIPSSAVSSDFTRVMKRATARATVRLHPYQRRNKIALRQDRRLALHPLTPAALPVAPVRTMLENLAPWLLVMSGVLLALLVLLDSLLLLHHHQ